MATNLGPDDLQVARAMQRLECCARMAEQPGDAEAALQRETQGAVKFGELQELGRCAEEERQSGETGKNKCSEFRVVVQGVVHTRG